MPKQCVFEYSYNFDCEQAHNTLKAICRKHPHHVLSHMAFSCSLYLKELPNKAIEFATEFLHRVSKTEIRHSQFEHHQQLLLTLAQMKLDRLLANNDVRMDPEKEQEALQEVQKICLDVLKMDASSSKAWEMCAVTTEKLSKTDAACKHFGRAWNLGNKTNPFLGYSLARLLLKLRRYTECIDVGHQVLDKDPGFKEINNVIDRALSRIRA